MVSPFTLYSEEVEPLTKMTVPDRRAPDLSCTAFIWNHLKSTQSLLFEVQKRRFAVEGQTVPRGKCDENSMTSGHSERDVILFHFSVQGGSADSEGCAKKRPFY